VNEWTAWVPSVGLALVVLGLAIEVVRLRRQVRSLAADVAASPLEVPPVEPEVLEASAEVSPATAGAVADDEATYVVTAIAEAGTEPLDERRIEGSLFADLVLRESVVKGVSLIYGVRRALAAETRNRIRFQMRQEVKRSRKQRRIDLRAARRHLADLQRDEDAA
jgi:hypothetical protein